MLAQSVCAADDWDLSDVNDHDQACTWLHILAAYSRQSDHNQMLIDASLMQMYALHNVHSALIH